MINKLENALDQIKEVFTATTFDIQELREKIQEIEVMTNKHESINIQLAKTLNNFYKEEI